MKSEDYRSYLVECVKAAGQMIIDMADDIVGKTDAMTNLALEVSFDQENRSIPEITITRMYLDLSSMGSINTYVWTYGPEIENSVIFFFYFYILRG